MEIRVLIYKKKKEYGVLLHNRSDDINEEQGRDNYAVKNGRRENNERVGKGDII